MFASLVAAVLGKRSVCQRPHGRGADRQSSVEQRSVFWAADVAGMVTPWPFPSVRSSHAHRTVTVFALRDPITPPNNPV